MRRVEGFTLPELIMVIVILGILGAFIGPVVYNALRAYEGIQTTTNTNAKVRYAMERIAREMRDIRRQVTDSAAFDIPSMSASSIAFVKTDGTQVVLSGAGSVVNLAYTGIAGMLLDGLQPGSFSLGYLQQDGTTVAASAASISFVQVSMTLTADALVIPARLRIDLRNAQ